MHKIIDLDSSEDVQSIIDSVTCMSSDYTYLKLVLTRRCSTLAQLPFMSLGDVSQSPYKHRVTKINQIKQATLLAFVQNTFTLCTVARQNEDFNLVYKQLANLESVKAKFVFGKLVIFKVIESI